MLYPKEEDQDLEIEVTGETEATEGTEEIETTAEEADLQEEETIGLQGDIEETDLTHQDLIPLIEEIEDTTEEMTGDQEEEILILRTQGNPLEEMIKGIGHLKETRENQSAQEVEMKEETNLLKEASRDPLVQEGEMIKTGIEIMIDNLKDQDQGTQHLFMTEDL